MNIGGGDSSGEMKLQSKRDDDNVGKNPNLNPTHIEGSSGQPSEGSLMTYSDVLHCVKSIRKAVTAEEFDEFYFIIEDYKEQRIEWLSAEERIKRLLEPYQEILYRLKVFLPHRDRILFPPADELHDVEQSREYDLSMRFLDNVKKRLEGDEDLYECILNSIDLYRRGKKSLFEFHQTVSYLFYNHKDLLREFNCLIPADFHEVLCESDPNAKSPARDDKELQKYDDKGKKLIEWTEIVDIQPTKQHYARILEETVMDHVPLVMRNQMFSLLEKVKKQLCNHEDYRNFLNCIRNYHSENLNKQELGYLMKVLLGAYPDIMKDVNEVILREKRKRKRSSRLEACNPSYHPIPKDCPISQASHRTELDKQVLNDYFVSVVHPCSNQVLKNKYEEILFKYEDIRSFREIVVEVIKVTIQRAEELIRSIDDQSIKTNGRFLLEHYFPSTSLRFLTKLYGKYGILVLRELRKNLSNSLPIILCRLKQKEEEWMSSLDSFDQKSFFLYELGDDDEEEDEDDDDDDDYNGDADNNDDEDDYYYEYELEDVEDELE